MGDRLRVQFPVLTTHGPYPSALDMHHDKTPYQFTLLYFTLFYLPITSDGAVNICVDVFGTIAEPSAPSCDGVCLGLAVGLTIGAVVLIAIVVLLVDAYRRGRLPSPPWRRTDETSTGTAATSPHKTVIHVGSDNEEEDRYNRIDNTADTPDDEYLHIECSDVFNSAA